MSSKRDRKLANKTYEETGRFFALPHHVIHSERFRKLSPTAKALLLDLGLQLSVKNNGDITAAQTIMAPFGWKDSTRKRALKELIENGLLWVTRQGGRNRCSLYAFTWRSINECGGKLDVNPTQKPPVNFFKETAERKMKKLNNRNL